MIVPRFYCYFSKIIFIWLKWNPSSLICGIWAEWSHRAKRIGSRDFYHIKKKVRKYKKSYLIRNVFICLRQSFRTCSRKSPSICAATCRFCSNIWWRPIKIKNWDEYCGLQYTVFVLSNRKKSHSGFGEYPHLFQYTISLNVCKSIQIKIHKYCTLFTWAQTIFCTIKTKTWSIYNWHLSDELIHRFSSKTDMATCKEHVYLHNQHTE